MRTLFNFLKTARQQNGASAVAYAILLMMVAGGVIGTLSVLGDNTSDIFDLATGSIDPNGENGGNGNTNTPPTISAILNDTISENGSYGPIAFTVSDAETAATSLTVTAFASNTELFPPSRITIGGSGESRTISATPEPNQSGISTFTVTVDDGTDTASEDFFITVTTDATPEFVAIGTGDGVYSADGSTWTTSAPAAAAALNGITYDGTNYVAVGNASGGVTQIRLSADGQNWSTPSGTLPSGSYYRVASGNGRLVAIGLYDDIAAYSTDGGNNWTQVNLGVSITPAGIAFGAGTFLAAGSSGIASSTDGISWTQLDTSGTDLGSTAYLEDIVYGDGYFVASGYDDNSFPFIIYANGNSLNTWSQPTTPSTAHALYGIGYGNGIFVGVGDPGSFLISSNLGTWTLVTNGSSEYTYDAFYAGGNYIAVGDAGTILSSSDANIWAAETSNTTDSIYGVVGGDPTANGGPADSSAPYFTSSLDGATIYPNATYGPIALTFDDADTDVNNITATAVSDNQTLVQNSNIIIGGSGGSRTITITPETGQAGVATITVTLDDGHLTTDGNFDLTVSGDQKILAADGAAADQFGDALALSGNTAVVGAPFDDDGGSNSGSAYILSWSGTSWSESKITASDATGSDFYGADVGVSSNRIVVGSLGSESAYVYNTSGGSEAILTASDATGGSDQFGEAVATDGDRVIVGAYGKTAVYIYDWNGSSWIETKVTPSGATSGFGKSVAISGDRAVVGAPNDTDNGADSGAIFVFDWNGSSWIETKLTASDAAASDEFGADIAIDGTRLIAGARKKLSSTGAAYIFDWNGSSWVETKLTASDGQTGEEFGISVAIQGSRAIVGAGADVVSGNEPNGAAYLFEYSGSWNETKLTAVDGGTGDRFGSAVAVSSSRSLIGARTEDENANDAGSVYDYLD